MTQRRCRCGALGVYGVGVKGTLYLCLFYLGQLWFGFCSRITGLLVPAWNNLYSLTANLHSHPWGLWSTHDSPNPYVYRVLVTQDKAPSFGKSSAKYFTIYLGNPCDACCRLIIPPKQPLRSVVWDTIWSCKSSSIKRLHSERATLGPFSTCVLSQTMAR